MILDNAIKLTKGNLDFRGGNSKMNDESMEWYDSRDWYNTPKWYEEEEAKLMDKFLN